MIILVHTLEKCKPFCDYGMKNEIMIPESAYDEFVNALNSIMMLLAMSEYRFVYNGGQNKNQHYFKFMLGGQRAFTFTILNEVDKYRSSLTFAISHHFHNDDVLMQKYKKLFDDSFNGKGFRDDNIILFETEQDMVQGLNDFAKFL